MVVYTSNHSKNSNSQNIERPPLSVSRQFGMKGQYVRYDTRFDWMRIKQMMAENQTPGRKPRI